MRKSSKKIVILLVLILGTFFSGFSVWGGEVQVKVGALGGFFQKKVHSIKERRYLRLVRQRYDLSCGSAALATLLKYYYGVRVSEELIIQDLLQHSDPEKIRARGFSMLDLKRSAERFGFQAEGYKVALEKLPLLKIPTIILLDRQGYKHFVVLKGVKAGKVFVADPAFGHRVIPMKEFRKSWNGILLAVMGKSPASKGWPLQTTEIPKQEVWALEDVVLSHLLILNQPFEIKP